MATTTWQPEQHEFVNRDRTAGITVKVDEDGSVEVCYLEHTTSVVEHFTEQWTDDGRTYTAGITRIVPNGRERSLTSKETVVAEFERREAAGEDPDKISVQDILREHGIDDVHPSTARRWVEHRRPRNRKQLLDRIFINDAELLARLESAAD
jgi:hypothetical protein